jgi:hypothetical protein
MQSSTIYVCCVDNSPTIRFSGNSSGISLWDFIDQGSCKWDVDNLGPDARPSVTSNSGISSRSIKSLTSSLSSSSTPVLSRSSTSSSSRSSTAVAATPQSISSENDIKAPGQTKRSHRVVFLTEQVLHHPPVSAFYGECRERGISIRGFDQISARFTGTCTYYSLCCHKADYSGQSIPRGVQ